MKDTDKDEIQVSGKTFSYRLNEETGEWNDQEPDPFFVNLCDKVEREILNNSIQSLVDNVCKASDKIIWEILVNGTAVKEETINEGPSSAR